MRTATCLLLMVSALLPVGAQGGRKDYADPTQAFAISVPADWQANRSQLGDSGWHTEFKGPGEASLGVMNFPTAGGTGQANLEQVAALLIGAVVNDLGQTGEVLSQKTSAAKFGTLDAVRCDLKVRPQQGATENAYLLVFLGKRNAFLAYVSAPENDAAGLKLAESCLATLALEAAQPNAGGAAPAGGALGQSLLTSSALAKAAQVIQGGMKRDTADQVLVAGNPPLTYASVVNFVQILSFAYDIELTETEFESVRQRFVECFPKLDGQGKMILAQGGASILAGLSKDAKERDTQKQDIREKTMPVLQRQAGQGITYAVALWEAIQRRSNVVAAAQGAKPAFADKGGFDNEMSEADLEASLEMLYFMWVASGRDPNLVTQDAIVTVRAALVQNFAAFPPQMQYLLANAQKVYSGMRGQWEQADLGTRAQLAAGYGQTLDAIGLTVPRPGGGGGGGGGGGDAWSDVKPEDMSTIRAEAMANSAFLSTNSWYNTSH